jgi:3-oxoacyl-[acyl-carrier-protein] synthase II
MLAGERGISKVQFMPTEDLRTVVAGQINDEVLKTALRARKMRSVDRTVDLGILAAGQALEDAGLREADAVDDLQPCAVLIGSGVGSAHSIFKSAQSFNERGIRGCRPTTVPRCMANATSAHISMRYKLTGPNYVTVCACSSSSAAMGNALRMIRHGYIDCAVCGGSDAFLDPGTFASWNNLGVMSKNPDPEQACRPFDADRDGCVLGEGAAMLVFEDLERARARGARILAIVQGFGESSDAGHITTPDSAGQVRSMKAALSDAGMTPSDIGLINAHGTATVVNDPCEAKTIREVFGDAADTVPTVSNKSYFGHLLGASGAIETIVSVKALETGQMPGNRNLATPDPECAICLPDSSVKLGKPAIIKNSFGFGGNNAVLILTAP